MVLSALNTFIYLLIKFIYSKKKLKYKIWNLLEKKKQRQYALWFWPYQYFSFWCVHSGKGNKSKNKYCTKLKKLLCSEWSYQQSGKSAYEWKKIFANNISHNRLISKIYKELVYSKKKKGGWKMARRHE